MPSSAISSIKYTYLSLSYVDVKWWNHPNPITKFEAPHPNGSDFGLACWTTLFCHKVCFTAVILQRFLVARNLWYFLETVKWTSASELKSKSNQFTTYNPLALLFHKRFHVLLSNRFKKTMEKMTWPSATSPVLNVCIGVFHLRKRSRNWLTKDRPKKPPKSIYFLGFLCFQAEWQITGCQCKNHEWYWYVISWINSSFKIFLLKPRYRFRILLVQCSIWLCSPRGTMNPMNHDCWAETRKSCILRTESCIIKVLNLTTMNHINSMRVTTICDHNPDSKT